VRPFRLADPAFAALAAGRPAAATLVVLRKAQLSRHLLLLYEARRAGWPDDPPGDLSDPMTGLYAAAALGAARNPAESASRPAAHLPPAALPGGRLLTASHDGLSLRVRLEDTHPARGRLGLTPTGRLDTAAAGEWQRHLDEAWRLLVTHHRPAARTLAAVLSVIVPVEPEPSGTGISATSAHAFGAVAMSAPSGAVALAAGLLHETQHSLLNAASGLFPLVRSGNRRVYSPWRDDPRPPFGLLHGAYAYQAVTRFWRAEARRAPANAVAAFEFARWREAVVTAADALLRGDELTPAGRRFAGALRDEVAPWRAEPLPAGPARLAAGANADHYARWRLRHLANPPGAVDALVAAWRAGAAAPAIGAPAVRPAVGRALERSHRLDLVHAVLRGAGRPGAASPVPGGGVRPGDAAWLGGDAGASSDAYLSEITNGRDDLALWSGLAVVSPSRALRERPELVRAAHQALDRPDLRRLAGWMSHVAGAATE
jgi:hypothetical protein